MRELGKETGFYGKAWSILLGHEILHVVGDGSTSCSVGIPGVGENADTRVVLNGEEEYGFNQSRKLRSTIGNKNSDSLMIFGRANLEPELVWHYGNTITREQTLHREDSDVLKIYGLEKPA